MTRRVSRRETHVVVIDGVARKLPKLNGNLKPLKRGFAQYLRLAEAEGKVTVEKIRAGSIRDLEGEGLFGQPVGEIELGVVFRLIDVS